MSGEVVCAAPIGNVCGEGAVWHAAENAVYWVDINRFLIQRFQPADASVCSWIFGEPVTALSLTDDDDVLLVVLGSKVILWEPSTDTRHDPLFKYDAWPTVRLNDARSDPRGSLWMGSMRNNIAADGSAIEFGGTDGVLLRLDPDGKTSVRTAGIFIRATVSRT
jgi:sugar lactone lactonase YvrE